MLQMYLVFVISFTPVWTAGKLSEDVQAALGMASQAQLFLNVVCMGLASGATAAISQSLGALRRRRAEYYVTATCLGSLFAGLIIGAAGYAFTDLVLALTNIPVGIRPVAGEIWKIFMLALPFQYVYSATGVIFRATRMVIPPLIVAAFVALVHAFICIGTGLGLFGLPDWGYRGIAWAGFAAEFVGAAVNCVLLLRAGHLHAASLPPVRWLRKGLPYLVRVAIPAGISSLVWQSGYLVLFILVATVPVERVAALAGLTAGLRIEALVFMPGMAFNSSLASSGKAVASMVGLVGSDDSVFCWLFWVVVEVPSFFWMAQPGHTKAESTARIITTAAATTTAINLPWDCVVEEFSLLVMPRFSHSRVTLGGRNFSRCAQAA